jgi:hypothetical protein
MSANDNWIAQTMDVFFNKRRAPGMPQDERKTITVHDLIARGTSHVRVGGKTYKIAVTEVQET